MANIMDCDKDKSAFSRWLPVISLTFATFIFNTSEFIPIGLLTDIANDFTISESKAGLLITVYAWVVGAMSLPLMLVFSKAENKKLLIGVIAVFVLSHAISGISTSYTMLMISRMGVACAHSIFWSIVTPIAVRVAPEGKGSTALSLIVTGSSVAMILGLPLGRAIGLAVGWRTTFLIIGAVAAVVLILIVAVLPKVPSDNDFSISQLPSLLRTPGLIKTYILTVIMISGHFTVYSYIEPFLQQSAGLSPEAITFVLSGFGVMGIIGSFFFSRHYDAHHKAFTLFALAGIPAFILLLGPSAQNQLTVIAVCLCWGLAINSYNLTFQSRILQIAPHGTEIAMAIYSGIYNVGIGAGALIGGTVCSHIGIGYIGYIGGTLGIAAAGWYLSKTQKFV